MVDDSFDVGLAMTFNDEAALHAYETHPQHVKAVTEVLRPLAGKTVVYDISERTPRCRRTRAPDGARRLLMRIGTDVAELRVALRHRDLPRLGFLALVQRDRQHAVGQLRVDGLLVDGRREREAAEEAGVTPLVEQQARPSSPSPLLRSLAALGGDRQRLVLQRDVDLVLLEAGQLGFDVDVVAVLADVDARTARASRRCRPLASRPPKKRLSMVSNSRWASSNGSYC